MVSEAANDYVLEPPFYTSARTEISRGRMADGRPLIGKVIRSQTPDELADLRHEYVIMSSVRSPYVPEVVDLVYEPGQRAVLLMEDIGATDNLARVVDPSLKLGRILQFATSSAAALDDLHRAGITHYAVNPTNVIWAEEAGRVQLIDFADAMRLETDRRDASHGPIGAQELAYMSPEQTGRMNCGVDYRTDLYSFGIMLYEWLAKRLPFREDDALGWTRAHIATAPVPLHEQDPSIPRPLSEIVARLLEKDRERRYRTARGLLRDLEHCATQLETTGSLGLFPLGEHDVTEQLVIPGRLYGRDEGIAELLYCFDQVAERGETALLLVRGEAGIGKSALVGELARPLAQRRGVMGAGKFEALQRATPMLALGAAFEEVAQQLLRLTDDALASRRKRILDAVGTNAGILVELAPSLGAVLGPQPPVPELGDVERRNRNKLAIERFVAALASPDQPLVLFLDDLQWLDQASLEIFEHLLTAPSMRGLMLIGAYRSDEVDEDHALLAALGRLRASPVKIRELELDPLSTDDVAHFVADTLAETTTEVAELAHLAHEKTAGNPFFLRQFLDALRGHEAITFDARRHRWTWDLEHAANLGSTDNVVRLLVSRLEALPDDARRLTQLAGCVGTRCDLATLATLAERAPHEVLTTLEPALDNRLLWADHALLSRRPNPATLTELDEISPKQASQMWLRFPHDRVQQAAVDSIGDKAAQGRIHLRVGRTLQASLGPVPTAAQLFEVADRLNAGRTWLDDDERRMLVLLDLDCGRQAIEAAAFPSAATYLDIAAELLGDGTQDPDAWFQVHLNLARASCLAGDYARAGEGQAALRARASTDEEWLGLDGILVDFGALTGSFDVGIVACRDALSRLGIPPPDDPEALGMTVGEEMAAIQRNLAGRELSSLVDSPALTSSRQARILAELDRLSTMSYLANDWLLYAWAVARMASISLEHGHNALSGLAYACFSALLTLQGQHELSEEYGALGIEVVNRLANASVRARAYVAHYLISGQYHRPVGDVPALFYREHPHCVEAGDLTYGGYLLLFADHMSIAAGESLSEVSERASRHLRFFERSAPFSLSLFYGPYILYLLQELRGSAPGNSSYAGSEAELGIIGIPIAEAWRFSAELKLAALTDQPIEIPRVQQMVGTVEEGVKGQFHCGEARFYGSLILLAALRERDLDAETRASAIASIDAWLGLLRADAGQNHDNFGFMVALIEAERARLDGNLRATIAGFEAAIDHARSRGNPAQEALSRRLYADHWLDLGATSTAVPHAGAAVELYRRWGADRVATYLEERYPQLREDEAGSRAVRAGSVLVEPLQQIDQETMVRAARALSRETQLAPLLRRLVEIIRDNVGATRCLLLRTETDPWPVVTHEGREDYPSGIVNYVRNSETALVLDDPAGDPAWSTEAYVLQYRPRSVLCMPVRREGRTLALVYAENELTPRAFTTRHLTLLRTVLAQAAISLDNARLFDALQEEKELWHSLVDNAADLIVIVDENHRAEFVNRSSQMTTGPRLGAEVEDSFSSDLRSALSQAIDDALRDGLTWSRDAVLGGDGGEPIHVSLRVGRVQGRGGKPRASLIATDRRQSKQLADQLRQAQKMEAVGNLAGGIAHDFNNLLTIILGTTELGKLDAHDDAAREVFDEITEAAERAAELTRNLLAFSRKQVLVPKVVEADGLLEGLLGLLQRLLGEDIELSVKLDGDDTRVLVDQGGIEQVVLNLVTNARDAMPRGGKLSFSTYRRCTDEGTSFVLEVEDDGDGMDEATHSRIFEPFFTTKEQGRGTGLGLAMVHGIVEQSGGTVEVDSQLGKGTCFRVLLPAVEAEADDHKAQASGPPPRGDETVLVVEDDGQLLSMVATMLRRLGYTVLEARSAAEAIELARKHETIHLLFTDVVMPVTSGPALASELRRDHPRAKVLFTSGYTDDAVLRHGLATGTVAMLEKPYPSEKLAEKVREVLDLSDATTES